ncbi:nucleoside-diphosphate sugar epimerase/dehydratase [Candidatus Albibeggiatoa sp. nov. NOAA]|uniref:polysaccharide biosynthesis protein n=1 Tax=Candidatus Albibeggiatoa sp. nov. NOAA TaxID=3162724 RepID=UPI0033013B7C|nr:polysaccharide biosynthesis protein [Thiotrichaceae bacterium]
MSRLHHVPILIYDALMAGLAWVLAILVRYNFQPNTEDFAAIYLFPIVMGVQVWIAWRSGLQRGIWRYASMHDVRLMLNAAFSGILVSALILFILMRLENIPRSSLIFYPFILIILWGLPRLAYRLWCEHSFSFFHPPTHQQKVLILGAGTSGDMLVRDMVRTPQYGYLPVGFLDDQAKLLGGKLHGVPVLGSIDDLQQVVDELDIDVILIAMPSATDEQMRRVVELCEQSHVPFRTLPKLDNVVNGQVDLTTLRDVSIDDLLGRAKVELEWQTIQTNLQKKTVMVTGGGGSIGSELCRQVAKLDPKQLIIFERSEFNLYQIELQLRQTYPSLTLHACLGDITDKITLEHILQRYQPQVIFHAAAYKHVPMLQDQVRQAAYNNILGTKRLADLASQYQCETFVMISTDKAVNPTNVMGTTKRIAEIYCQGLNERTETKFITVRFGNVLGSAGSVVPLFKQQIRRGGPVTVTHPEISRYFMTIPEACQLILQGGAMGQGGEIFVLDMGKPIKIRYLAEQLIRLSGKIPDQDIKIQYTGLRAGEKLHEELFHDEEEFAQTRHQKILLALHRTNHWERTQDLLQKMEQACDVYDEVVILQMLKILVPEMHSEKVLKV